MSTPRWAVPLLLLTMLFLGISDPRTSDATPVHGAVHDTSTNTVVLSSVSPAPTADNQRPPKPVVTDQTTYAGGTFTYTVPEVTDPDEDPLTYQAFLGASNPLPRWITFDSDTRTFTFKPRNPHVGEMQIRVSVSDGSLESYADFTLEVTAQPPNRPPTASTLIDQTATEDEAFSYTVPAFTDPDENTLTYTAAQSNGSALPGWLSFNANTRTLSGTPEEADTPATLTISITASDGTESISATFTLTVEEVNDPPTVPSLPAQTTIEGQAFSYEVPSFVDPEGGSVTYTAMLDDGSALPAWLTFDSESHTLSGTPDDADTPATLTISITASDGTLSSSATFTISVPESNQRPPKPEVTDQTATTGRPFSYQVPEVIDPDRDSLTYQAFLGQAMNPLPLWLTFDAATRTISGTSRPAHVGTMSILVDVSDGSLSASATFTLEVVLGANRPPTAPMLTDQTATEDEPFSYTAPAFTDPDEDTLTYTAAQSNNDSLPSWLSFNADTRTLSGTPTEADTPATLSIRVTASDETLSSSATFTLTVAEVNDPPAVPSIPAQTAIEGQAFSYQAPSFVDPEGESVTYTATLNDGSALPAWLTFDSESHTLSGTPSDADTPATLTISITASDGTLSSSTTFTISVPESNQRPPKPNVTGQTTYAGATFTYTVPEVIDPDSDDLTYQAFLGASNPLPRWISFNSDTRTFTIRPRNAHIGELQIRVSVSDGSLESYADFTLEVTAPPPNRPPTAPMLTDQTATEDEPFSYTAPAFTDPDEDTLTYTAAQSNNDSLPGWLSFNADTRTLSGTPEEADTPATFSIRVTASDETESTSATFTLTVEEVNDPPVASNDSASVAEGGTVSINSSTLLSNDSDPEDNTLSVNSVGSTVNGSISLSEDKATITYTHDGSETTSGSFTYTISDGSAASTATVNVTVTPANDSPTASNDSASVAEGGTLTINSSTLLSNDSDPEGNTLSVTSVGSAVNGSVSLSEDKATVTYIHDGSETTSGSFTYTISDGSATSTATVNITVTPVNDPPGTPSLTDQNATAGQPFTYQVPEVIDPEGDSLTYNAALGQAMNPLPLWLTFNAETRTFSGTPRRAHVATHTIVVEVSDSSAKSSRASFTLRVALPPNRPPTTPILAPQTATEDQSFSYTFDAVTDPEGDGITYAAALNDDGTLPAWLSFTPNSLTFSGTPLEPDTPNSLTIRVTATDDGEPSQSTSATFALTVEEVNDPPVTPSLSDQVATEDEALSYTFDAVTDPEGDGITYGAALADDTALPGWLNFDAATRTFSGTPREADVPATLIIRVAATDNGTPPATASATFTLMVSELNDTPIAGNDTATVPEGGAVSIAASTLLANDSDPNDDTLTITAVSDAVSGTVVLSEDGATVTYTHNGLETRAGGFTYTVSDGSATDTATVVITVTPVNDPPTTPSLSDQAATEDEPFSYTFDAVTDPENDGITYEATHANDSDLPGWLSFDAATRTLSGTPLESDTPDTFTIRVTATDDGEPQESASATFTLTVEEVNDPPTAPVLSDQTAFVEDLFSYTTPEASDPEGSTLTYDAFQGTGNNPLPRWLQFDKNTRTFSGTPLEADMATHEIMVSVSDDLYTRNATFQLSVVLPANRPPTASTFQSQTATEDRFFFYQALAFDDPDGNTLTYIATLSDGSALPAWLDFTANTSALIFRGTPREADTPDTLAILVTATDGTETAAAAFTLTVFEVNDLPTANAGPDQTVGEGATVSLDGSGSFDPEGLPLVYAWTQTSGPSVALSGVDTASPVFTAPDGLADDAVLRFALVVTDASNAASTADDVRVLVKTRAPLPILPVVNPTPAPIGSSTPTPIATQAAAPNRTPTFDSGVVEDMIFTVGQHVETSPLPSARGGDGTLRYRLSPVLPGGLHFDASSRTITGVPTRALERTRFTYTATNSNGDSASLRFNITVVEQVVTVGTGGRGEVTPILPPAIEYGQTPEPTPTPIPPPTTTWSLMLTPTPSPQPTASPTPQPVPTTAPWPRSTASPTPTSTLAATATPSPPAVTSTAKAAPENNRGASAQVWVIMVIALAVVALAGVSAAVMRRRR